MKYIEKGNKLMHKFMGSPSVGFIITKDSDYRFLQYNSCWMQLMQVIEKIATLNDGVKVEMYHGTGCTDSFSNMKITYTEYGMKETVIFNTPLLIKNTKDSTDDSEEDGSEGFLYSCYKTVVIFLEWYNENKTVKSN